MKIIEIKEDVKIKQEDRDIILEKGDKIKIIKEQLVRPVVYNGDFYTNRDDSFRNVKTYLTSDYFPILEGAVMSRRGDYVPRLEKNVKKIVELANYFVKEMEKIRKDWP